MREKLDLQTLKSYFKYIRTFILDVEVCIANIEEIIKAQSENVNLIPIQNFLFHFVYLSYSKISINFYKIYKANEKRSFQKLFNKIKEFEYSDDIEDLFSQNLNQDDSNLIKSREELLIAVKNSEEQISLQNKLLEKLKGRRDKFYAHSDPDGEKIERENLSELKEIKELSINVYNILYGKLFSSYFMFESHVSLIEPIINDRKIVDKYWTVEENKLK